MPADEGGVSSRTWKRKNGFLQAGQTTGDAKVNGSSGALKASAIALLLSHGSGSGLWTGLTCVSLILHTCMDLVKVT